MSPSSQLEPWVTAESHHETFMILTGFDLLEFLPFQLQIFYFTVYFVVAEKTLYLPSMVFCLWLPLDVMKYSVTIVCGDTWRCRVGLNLGMLSMDDHDLMNIVP